MIYFAVKHKASGKFLGVGKGSTYWDPETAPITAPRLFRRKQDAGRAIHYWLLGKWRNEVSYSSHESFEADEVELTYSPVPGRKAGDLVVVKLKLEEVK